MRMAVEFRKMVSCTLVKLSLTLWNLPQIFSQNETLSHRIVNKKHKNVFKLLDGLYSEKIQFVTRTYASKFHTLICSQQLLQKCLNTFKKLENLQTLRRPGREGENKPEKSDYPSEQIIFTRGRNSKFFLSPYLQIT